MRQRNTSGYTLVIPSLNVQVYPDDVIDHPDLIAGFEPVPIKTKTTKEPAEPAGSSLSKPAPGGDEKEAKS